MPFELRGTYAQGAGDDLGRRCGVRVWPDRRGPKRTWTARL